MEKTIFERPFDVVNALSKGKKTAIFEVDKDGNPIFCLSAVKMQKAENFAKKSEIIKPALTYIRDKFNRELRLDTLADMCGLSKSYFCRLFKNEMGVGVTEYIIKKRLDEACRLLETGDDSVVVIALKVGYVDCGYFNKLFKKHLGCTPLEYRNRPLRVLLP